MSRCSIKLLSLGIVTLISVRKCLHYECFLFFKRTNVCFFILNIEYYSDKYVVSFGICYQLDLSYIMINRVYGVDINIISIQS
jgi:hypothetical protein